MVKTVWGENIHTVFYAIQGSGTGKERIKGSCCFTLGSNWCSNWKEDCKDYRLCNSCIWKCKNYFDRKGRRAVWWERNDFSCWYFWKECSTARWYAGRRSESWSLCRWQKLNCIPAREGRNSKASRSGKGSRWTIKDYDKRGTVFNRTAYWTVPSCNMETRSLLLRRIKAWSRWYSH